MPFKTTFCVDFLSLNFTIYYLSLSQLARVLENLTAKFGPWHRKKFI